MTIYVDQLISYPQQAKAGERYFGNGKESCHLACDGNLDELHASAARLGLKREWFQNHKSVPHYDLTPNKRAQAVRYGATEVLTSDLVRLCSQSQHGKQAADQEGVLAGLQERAERAEAINAVLTSNLCAWLGEQAQAGYEVPELVVLVNESEPGQPLLDLVAAVRLWRAALAGPDGVAVAEQQLLAALDRYEQRPQ